MRIVLIAPPWLPVPPTGYGGTETVVAALACGLQDAGHDVLLVATGDSACPVPRSWAFDHGQVDHLGSPVVELIHVVHAYDAARGADVIHDHTLAGPVYGDTSGFGPIVTTAHGAFSPAVEALYRSLSDRVTVVALSRHQASTAGGINIARIIPHGVDEEAYPVGAGDGGYLLFLGRMSPTKGVRDAIEVARLSAMPLVIAAKMRLYEERAYFDGVVAPLLGDGIEYAGEVGGAEKLALLGGAVALVNPIRWDEPFGLCMVEALACGTPVITSKRGAAPEIVDDGVTGFLATGTRTMAARVARIPSLDRGACRVAVEGRFSARRMAADHLALYEQVAAGSPQAA